MALTACPLCAEPLPAEPVTRCPSCGEELPAATPPRRGPRPLLICALASLPLLLAAAIAVWAATRPPWQEHPRAAPLFDATALSALPPAPAPTGVVAGERWTFRDEDAREDVVWEILSVDAAGVRYVERRPSGAGAPRTWAFVPLPLPEDVQDAGRERVEVGGRAFECLAVRALESRSMMNDFELNLQVAVSGDTPVFPGFVRLERVTNRTVSGGWWLTSIEPPAPR